MGDDFPYVPRIPYLLGSTVDTCSRQSGMLWFGWFCRLRCKPHAVFFDSGRCKGGFTCTGCVPFGCRQARGFWLHGVVDLKDIFAP